ncbi:hypothetical protein F4805DRAFT_456908 [Annulohypoxylon moriforme]|nr:hypothetical protein F4805DRAFT_456908 [Annulohypoxylon moriforme]
MQRLKALLRGRRSRRNGSVATKASKEKPHISKRSKFYKSLMNRGNTTDSQGHPTRQKYTPKSDESAGTLDKMTISNRTLNENPGIRETRFFPSLPTISSDSDKGAPNDYEGDIPERFGSEIPLDTSGQLRDTPTAPLGKKMNYHPRKSGKTISSPSNTADVDETTSYSRAVTHETIRPYVHEIKSDQIHREIHNHDVYHRVQPVYDIEVLPARHFILSSNGILAEATEDELPECTGSKQRWYIGEKTPPLASSPMD